MYGGGGLFGIGYTLGVAEALVDDGTDLSQVPALGTSAGSWAAAGLVEGIRFLDALAFIGDAVPRLPDPRSGRLERVSDRLFGPDVYCPTVRVVACSVPRVHRTVLSGAGHPVGELVAS